MLMVKEAKRSALTIEEQPLKKAALILRAINHRLRKQLVHTIHHSGRISVTDLYIKLHLEQSVASQHLAILRNAGFVVTQRHGKQIYYSVNYSRLQQVQEIVKELIR